MKSEPDSFERKYPSLTLYDDIIVTSSIECSKCKKVEKIEGESIDACDEFYAQGWRKNKNKIECPKCKTKK